MGRSDLYGLDTHEPRPVVPVTCHVCREVGERANPVPPLAVQRLVHDHRLLGFHVTSDEQHLVVVALEVSVAARGHVVSHPTEGTARAVGP